MHPERERGAALLTVLLLVAIISVIAATSLERLRLSTRLSINAVSIDQSRAYAQAAETLALTRVTDLLGRDPSRVTLAGGWSDRPFGLPVPGGIATARVTDGGNCFNLNSLVVETAPGTYASYTAGIVQFARLMRLLNVPGNLPDAIAAATADWIDSDDGSGPNGAEDGAYTGRDPPYRTAGTLMADPSELRAVTGMDAEIYARLRPWICALPIAARSVININTLTPEQAPLLAMLLPDTLGIEGARTLLLRRPPIGYASLVEFWDMPALSGIVAPQDARGQTDVTTTWFNLRVDVTQGPTRLREDALIDARALPARLVRRQWGEPT